MFDRPNPGNSIDLASWQGGDRRAHSRTLRRREARANPRPGRGSLPSTGCALYPLGQRHRPEGVSPNI